MISIQPSTSGYSDRHFESADAASIVEGYGAHGGSRHALFVLSRDASAAEAAIWNAIPKATVIEAEAVRKVGRARVAVRLTARTMAEAVAQNDAFVARIAAKKAAQADVYGQRAVQVAARIAEDLGIDVDESTLVVNSAQYKWSVLGMDADASIIKIDLSGPVFAMAHKPIAEIGKEEIIRMCSGWSMK